MADCDDTKLPPAQVEISDIIEKLDLVPRVVLEIVSLAGYPVSLRRLIEVGLPLTADAEFSPTRLGPVLTRLVASGLLKEQGDELTVPPVLSEPLSAASKLARRSNLIVDQLRKLEPWNSRLQRDPQALYRHFRYALYSDDVRQARGLATDLERLAHHRAWSDVGRSLPNPESFFVFTPSLALTLARETVVQSLHQPFAAPHAVSAYSSLLHHSQATVKDQQLYGHTLLMLEQYELFEKFLERFDFPMLRGCRKILNGDLEGMEDFRIGLQEHNAFPSYTALFLYLVAFVLQEGWESPETHHELSRFELFRPPFEWLLGVKAGQQQGLTPDMQLYLQEASPALLPHLSLLLSWAGVPHPEPRLEQRALEYRAAGYHVFANWLSNSAQDASPHHNSSCLLQLLQPEEPWRQVLSALQLCANSTSQPSASSQRLVWFLDPEQEGCKVEVRAQTLSLRAGWSPGRQLELEETWHFPPDYADRYDWAVFSALDKARRGERGLLYLNSTEQQNVALSALVGHPRVYLKDNAENPVELVLTPIALSVARLNDSLKLTLDPAPISRPAVLARPTPSGRVLVFEVKEQHVQLGKAIRRGVFIPPEGEDELKKRLEALTSCGLVLQSDIGLDTGSTTETAADLTLRIRLAPYGEGMSVQTRVSPLGENGPSYTPGQGSPVVIGRHHGTNLQARRDLREEKVRWRELQQWHSQFVATDFTLLSPLECLTFLEKFLDKDDDRFCLEWPEGEKFRFAARVTLSQLKPTVRSKGHWFSIGSHIQVHEELSLTLGDLLDARQSETGRFIPLSEGGFLALTEEVERYLERIEALALRRQGEHIEIHPLNALLALDGHDVQGDEAWEALKVSLENSRQFQPVLPSELQAELRDYQRDGVIWLLRLAHWGVGACLADDMGLGKTVQLLTVALARSSCGPSLVVAPTSLCWNWQEEARRFAPSLRVSVWGERELDDLGPGDLLVTSYGLLVNHSQELSSLTWATVILDEAQAIKNAETQRSRAAHALDADFRIAATGTPIENHLEEIWALFRFLNPSLLGSLKAFKTKFGSPKGQSLLSNQVKPFILRRTKSQVLHELPSRTDVLEKIPLSEQERALYESLRREALESLADSGEQENYLSVLAYLTKLRRVCCHPSLVSPELELPSSKLERALELVEELRDNGHRALIFSQFVGYLELLATALKDRGIVYAYLDGSTPVKARQKAVQAFQKGTGDVFLISLKAGGTGLNLTAADYVIHLDPWWNPAVEDQASDRAHRMGQQRPVTVYRLVAQDTVEEQIVTLHQQKRDLAHRLLTGTDASDRLSAHDLLSLLGHH